MYTKITFFCIAKNYNEIFWNIVPACAICWDFKGYHLLPIHS